MLKLLSYIGMLKTDHSTKTRRALARHEPDSIITVQIWGCVIVRVTAAVLLSMIVILGFMLDCINGSDCYHAMTCCSGHSDQCYRLYTCCLPGDCAATIQQLANWIAMFAFPSYLLPMAQQSSGL